MADFGSTLSAFAIFVLVTMIVWRRWRRPTSSRGAAARFAVAFVLGLALVLIPTYYLTKSRTVQIAGQLVSRVDTNEKVVALTFDDGPSAEYTDEVLRILEARDAHATFYLTGEACEQNPEALAKIVAAGHELGNHTFTHRRMYFLSGASVATEIERTDEVFRAAGYDGPITFRPPGCKRLLTTPLYLARHDRTTVTWDLEPDSLPGIADDADALRAYVIDNVEPGSIILLHPMYDVREPTREALPEILDALESEGYRFVTVSELMALR
jgi:peptidoglycan/xylan/chitin deacetylase (PgdA/CDA1 family)